MGDVRQADQVVRFEVDDPGAGFLHVEKSRQQRVRKRFCRAGEFEDQGAALNRNGRVVTAGLVANVSRMSFLLKFRRAKPEARSGTPDVASRLAQTALQPINSTYTLRPGFWTEKPEVGRGRLFKRLCLTLTRKPLSALAGIPVSSVHEI